MKKALRILLCAALSLSMVFAAVGCKTEVVEEIHPDPTWYEVTVVNGTVKNAGYNHDRVKEGGSITVVAAQPTGVAEDVFEGWYVGETQVSTNLEYTFTPEEDTTVTAKFGYGWSVWDGEEVKSEPDGYVEESFGVGTERKGGIVHIKSAEALVWWNVQLNAKKADGDSTPRGKYSLIDGPVRQTNPGGTWYYEENAWTFSLECNVDLSAGTWDAINDMSFEMEGATFEGNYHIIKGLRTEVNQTGGNEACGGFFGHIAGSSFTVQNVTFQDAFSTNSAKGAKNMAVVVGYAHSNNRQAWFNEVDYIDVHQRIVLDNVNVTESLITGGANPNKAGFYFGRVGTSWEGLQPSNIVIKNCTVSDSKIAVWRYAGSLIGYMYAYDWDINMKVVDKYEFHNNTVTNVDIVTGIQVGATVDSTVGRQDRGENFFYKALHTDFSYDSIKDQPLKMRADNTAATLGMWDCGYAACSPIELDPETTTVENVNVINLNIASGSTALQYATDKGGLTSLLGATTEDHYTNTLIFVPVDIAYDSDDKLGDYEPNDEQKIVLVAGAQVTGIDINKVYYLSGETDENGYIITDATGATVAHWKVTVAENDSASGAWVE